MLRNVVLGWVPWADVEEVKLDEEGGAWQVRLRATIAVSGFARPEGKDAKTWVIAGVEPVHYVFPRAFATTLGTTYTAQRERATALSIEMPIQFHMKRRIELPPAATVERAPAPVAVDGELLDATRTTKVEGQTIVDELRLSLPTGTVGPEDYARFVDHVQAVDSGFMAGTRVKIAR